MSNTFTKVVLKPGRYRSPDGIIEVTPRRLRHWENQVKRVQAAGYTIPMHWNHADSDSPEDLAPIRLGTGNNAADKTVGKLLDFQVAADGSSAELTVQTLTESARDAVKSNAVFVSPVLWSDWQDGAGDTYTDIIGSVDFVDYPVDHSQEPFVQVAAMSTQPKTCVLRMSTTPSKIYRLSETTSVADENPDTNTDEGSASTDMLKACIDGLAKLGIVVPDDSTADNFFDRLNSSILTALAAKGEDDPKDDDVVTQSDPAIATMSTRVSSLETKMFNDEKARLSTRLTALLKSGRCTPAESNKRKQQLSIAKMSLSADNAIDAGDVGRWIEDRESLQVGACWKPEEKLRKMSTVESGAPEQWQHDASQPTEGTQKQQKARMLNRRG